jgi:hypothetical protein
MTMKNLTSKKQISQCIEDYIADLYDPETMESNEDVNETLEYLRTIEDDDDSQLKSDIVEYLTEQLDWFDYDELSNSECKELDKMIMKEINKQIKWINENTEYVPTYDSNFDEDYE